MPGDRWEGAKSLIGRLFVLEGVVSSLGLDLLFERERKRGKPLKGGWKSLAGQFAAALHPRAKTTGVVHVIQLTDRRLWITYVQRGRRNGDLGEVEPGWSVDIRQVAWLRDRRDVAPDNHEIGFVDGSWAGVHFSAPGSISFIEFFPRRLRHDEPVP
ncbi:hypothetical protein ABZW18_20370 [Streptomyces sp. NPDC004647]|uniref:hypothetical protein n=1 Tax=Streptomyces sp. NPDC004647 TaxID=3154671 RepID=UPI0033A09007